LLGSSHDTLTSSFGKRSDPVNQLLKLLFTHAVGALDGWVGIITGVALGLSPALSGAVSRASALVGVTLVVAAGGRLRQLIYHSRRLHQAPRAHRARVEVLQDPGRGVAGSAAHHRPSPGDPPYACPRCRSSVPAVVDARQRSAALGGSSHRGRGPGLLDIRALADCGEPPTPEVRRTDLRSTSVNRVDW
jgi:hypothetical protein